MTCSNRGSIGTFTGQDMKILETICSKHNLPLNLVTKLIDAEIQSQGMSRRSSIYEKLGRILGEEWRSEEEILNEIEQNKKSEKIAGV